MIKLKSTDSYRAKNAPLWIALQQNGIMLLAQPAAGGECALHILFIEKKFQQGKKWLTYGLDGANLLDVRKN